MEALKLVPRSKVTNGWIMAVRLPKPTGDGIIHKDVYDVENLFRTVGCNFPIKNSNTNFLVIWGEISKERGMRMTEDIRALSIDTCETLFFDPNSFKGDFEEKVKNFLHNG